MPAFTSIALGVLATGSLVEGRKARKSAEKAAKVDQRRARLQSTRQSLEQVRKAQIARAQVLATGEQQGVAGSSAVLGGAGSIQTQAGGNIGFAEQLFSLQQSASRLRLNASMHAGQSQAFGTLASLAANSGRTDGGAPVSESTPRTRGVDF